MEKEITLQGYFAVALTFNDSADVLTCYKRQEPWTIWLWTLQVYTDKHSVTIWKAK
jgi:hypothetical protein